MSADQTPPMPNTPESEPALSTGEDSAQVSSEWSPVEREPVSHAEGETRDFEELTLAQALGQLLRRPAQTTRAIAQVVAESQQRKSSIPQPMPAPTISSTPKLRTSDRAWWQVSLSSLRDPARRRLAIQLAIYMIGLLVALYGTSVWADAGRRTEETFYAGLPFILLGIGVWLAAEIYGLVSGVDRQGKEIFSSTLRADALSLERSDGEQPIHDVPVQAGQENNNAKRNRIIIIPDFSSVRFMAGFFGTLGAVLAMLFNTNNVFTLPGVLAWIISITLWIIALAPTLPVPSELWQTVLAWRPKRGFVLAAALAFVLLGSYFRLHQLDTIPAEITSDHYEKLRNAQDVLNGQFNVFFTNNGGREPFQMYAMALFSLLPGQGINHTSLKLLSALEGVITLPVMFWLGYEVIGRENRKLGVAVGLILMGLVAASYWHTTLSRMGLRIVLTPLMTALVFIFLSRGIRDGNRWSFLNAGLALGAGLYMYQAVRMIPVLVIASFFVCLFFRRKQWRQYVAHFASLVIMAFVVFTPLFSFSLQYPDQFWLRTTGRLFGDDFIEERDASGNLVSRRSPSLQERIAAFSENIPALTLNLRNALLMYNWQGDVQFINGAPNRPSMDAFTGALLIAGVGAWIGLMIRRRDPVIWLVPVGLLIMILPSALAIAMPGENPSATRISGSLPFVYLLAAVPLAALILKFAAFMNSRTAYVAGAMLTALVVWFAYSANAETYFVQFDRDYRLSVFAYSKMGEVLRGFAESDGSYGNAFMLGYPDGFGHREIGLAAGLPPVEGSNWPNGILWGDRGTPNAAANVPEFLYTASQRSDSRYRFDPTRDMLFFYSPEDSAALSTLQALFPDTPLHPLYFDIHPGGRGKFWIVRVPALGIAGFEAFLERTGARGG